MVTIAMISDLRSRKISNRLILCGYAICLAKAVGSFSPATVLEVLWNLSVPVIIGYFLYLPGVIGAGDIKLLSIISGFIGLYQTGIVALIALLIGGIWSLILLLQNRVLEKNMFAGICYIWELMQGNMICYRDLPVEREQLTIPFSVCIALAVYAVVVIYGR